MITLGFFALGLILGSFYNVVGLRVPAGESIVAPPSHCPHCGRRLSALELVPVFSYLFLKGQCRTCRAKISALYPATELAVGLLFAWAFHRLGWAPELAAALVLASLLAIVFVSDVAYMLIPDKILLVFAALFVALNACLPFRPWKDAFIGSAVGFLLPYAVAAVSRGKMGGGDIKLFAVLGFVLGWKNVLVAFFLSAFFGAVIGGAGLAAGKIKRGKPMPFAPFIALGAWAASFFGTDIWNWYFHFLSD